MRRTLSLQLSYKQSLLINMRLQDLSQLMIFKMTRSKSYGKVKVTVTLTEDPKDKLKSRDVFRRGYSLTLIKPINFTVSQHFYEFTQKIVNDTVFLQDQEQRLRIIRQQVQQKIWDMYFVHLPAPNQNEVISDQAASSRMRTNFWEEEINGIRKIIVWNNVDSD